MKYFGSIPVHVKIEHVTKFLEVHVLQGMKTQLLLGRYSLLYFNLSLDLTTLTLSQPNNVSLEPNTCSYRKTTVNIKADHLNVFEQNYLSVHRMEALR